MGGTQIHFISVTSKHRFSIIISNLGLATKSSLSSLVGFMFFLVRLNNDSVSGGAKKIS